MRICKKEKNQKIKKKIYKMVVLKRETEVSESLLRARESKRKFREKEKYVLNNFLTFSDEEKEKHYQLYLKLLNRRERERQRVSAKRINKSNYALEIQKIKKRHKEERQAERQAQRQRLAEKKAEREEFRKQYEINKFIYKFNVQELITEDELDIDFKRIAMLW
jgi:hypothetical protein